jgi:hypothetical protein
LSRIDEHLEQWQHNRKFLQDISPEFPDWIVTASLYVAIHAVEALLTADGAKARSRHQDRLEILQSEPRYQRIYQSFHVLYNLAHVTRYSAKPGRWMPSQDIEQKVIRDAIYPIEASVKRLLLAAKPSITMPTVSKIALKPAIDDKNLA